MAVAVATSPQRDGDAFHTIKFIVRGGGVGQTEGNTQGLRAALETAIAAGTIAVSGLELVKSA